jgi:hypothetical protein
MEQRTDQHQREIQIKEMTRIEDLQQEEGVVSLTAKHAESATR